MASKKLQPPVANTPVPPIPVPSIPPIPGLQPVTPTTTTTVPPSTPQTTTPSKGKLVPSNKGKTRLGTVSFEQLPGDVPTRLKTEAKAAAGLILNAPMGMANFLIGGGIDFGKSVLDVGSKLIPGVDFEAGKLKTTEGLIESVKGTYTLADRLLSRGDAQSFIEGTRPPGAYGNLFGKPIATLPDKYVAALEANQSILPFIVEDFGNISMAGGIYAGLAKQGVRGVTLGEAAAQSERAAAAKLLDDAAPGTAEAAAAAERVAKAEAKIAKIQKTKEFLQKNYNAGKKLERLANKVGAAPFKPYGYGTRKLLGLYRDGVYLGPNGRYARWGAKASEGYKQQAAKLMDEGVPADDPRVVNLMAKAQKAGRRSIAREVMQSVKEASRDASNEQGSAVRAIINQIQEPLHKDVINPETGEAYGNLSLDEVAAILAIQGGNAQIINRLATRYNIPPRILALLGRYDFYQEYSLSERAAEMARDFLNFSPETPGRMTIEQYERLANAAENVAKTVFRNMTERAVQGYGRRNPMPMEQLVPTPFVEGLKRNIIESIKQAEKAIKKEQAKKKPSATEINRLKLVLTDRINVLESWTAVEESGILELPVDHPDRIAVLKGFVDQLPIELALDPTMYSAAMRVPLEFYRRIRRGMAASIIGDTGTEVVPDGGGPGPRLSPARAAKEGAVEAELAKRSKKVKAIEGKITRIAEELDRKEAQHAKLVERIVRYDIVDAYVGGKSVEQIATEFELDPKLIEDVIKNSPPAKTYRRAQELKKAVDELRAQFTPEQLAAMPEMMAEAQRIIDEANAAQAEYQNVLRLAEEERQQIEAETDRLNDELDVLEDEMADYEDAYEAEGGVVDDLWDADETPALKPVVVEPTPTPPSGELSPFKKLTPSWENLRKTKAATFEKDFNSFEQLVSPQAGWKRGDVELYTPANLPGNNEINTRFLPYVTNETYSESSYLRHFYLSNPNSIILAIDYSGPKFVPHSDRIFIAVPETWQEFVEVLKAKIDDKATGKYKTAQNKLKKVLAIAEAQVAKGKTKIYLRDEAAAAIPNERQLKLAEDYVHHYNRVRDNLIEHEEGLREAIARNSQEAIDYHTAEIEFNKEYLDDAKQQFVNDFPFLDGENLVEIYKDFTFFDRGWVDRQWGDEKVAMPGEVPAFTRPGEETPKPSLTTPKPTAAPVAARSAALDGIDALVPEKDKGGVVTKRVGPVVVDIYNTKSSTGAQIDFMHQPSEPTASESTVSIYAPEKSIEYFTSPENFAQFVENLKTQFLSVYEEIKRRDVPAGWAALKKPVYIPDTKIKIGEVEVVRDDEDFGSLDPQAMLQAIDQIVSEINANSPEIPSEPRLSPATSTETPSALTPVQPAGTTEFTIESAQAVLDEVFRELGVSDPAVISRALDILGREDKPLEAKNTPKNQLSYLKSAIKSGQKFFVSQIDNIVYFSDGYVVYEMDGPSTRELFGLIDGPGTFQNSGPRNRKPSADDITRLGDDSPADALIKSTLKKNVGTPLKFLYNYADESLFLDEATGEVVAFDREKVALFGPDANFFLTRGKEGKLGPTRVVYKNIGSDDRALIMPKKASAYGLEATPPSPVERLENIGSAFRTMNKIGKTAPHDLNRIADRINRKIADIELAAPIAAPEAAPTPPALRPTEPKAPAKPKATKPSEVKPDTQIVDPVVREAVYTKEVVDSMAAEAAAKMDAAKTVQEKLSAFQEFVDKSKAYDAEVARMAIELEPARNARTKKLKVEKKIAELREAMEGLPEEQAAAEASVAAMLSNPFFEPYMKMTGSMPLEIALGGDFPSDIGGFEVPGPDGEGVRLIGPMYYPSGVPRKFYGGIEKETTRLGLPGFKKLASEHYRDGDRQVIFSLRQVAIRMGQEVAQMVKKERFRAIVSRFGSTASEILGEQYVRDLYKQAVAWAENMPQDSLYVRFRSAMAESLGEDMPISGIASPGPGVKGQARVREWAINFRFGELIGDAMRERGFEAIDPYAAIEKMIPAEKITASRGIEEPTDGTGDIGDVTPDEITQETMFLPRGLKEKMVEVIVVKDANRFQKMLTGAQKVTSFFKVGTLVFSIPWQVGDLVSSMIIATMSGVDPRVLIKYMKEIKVQEYGTGRAGLRRMVDPYIDESGKSKLTLRRLRDPEAVTDIGPFRRGPLARLASESGVQNLGQTLQERAYLYGEELQPQRGFIDRISRGRLKRVSDAAAAVTGFSFKVNETINKISRHAFFLEQLDQQLRARGQTLESIKNIEDWQNDAEIKQAVFDAARSANQWLGDYANLSLTERRYITSVFPFWAWIRHIHSVFDLVAVNNPEALFYYMYIGTLASEDEADPLNLRRGGFNIFGGVASSNWLNPFADVVDGPIAAALIDQDLRPAGSMFGPVPRLIGGAVGIDVSRPGSPISRPAGTGGYSETGQRTSGSVLPLLGGSVGETIGFTAQQFPIAQRILNINPTPFENIPGTRVALGQVARYQTGEARLSPTTGQRIQQPGGRAAALLRLFGGPLVPYRTDEQINDVLNAARQRLLTLDELQRIRELQGAP